MNRQLIHNTRIPILCIALLGATAAAADDTTATGALYRQHCAECHSADRLGALGPALLPENLTRLKRKRAAAVIADGRTATQMPPFRDKLSAAQIEALVAYIYTPLERMPVWDMAQISTSRILLKRPGELPERPLHGADPMNLFVVVELGDHHATILDGERMEPLARVKTRFALHGGPKYSPDGRFVYFTSRDGWISKFDMHSLQFVAEVRAGINARNAAVSADGRIVMVANYLPHTLVALDSETLLPIRVIEVRGEDGTSSRVSAVYTAEPRNSFIAALKDIPEVWEINYLENPPKGFGQWMHDYRADSGEPQLKNRLPVRRIKTRDYLDDFLFSQDYVTLVGASREGRSEVIDLDLGRSVRQLDLPGMPHLASGITWTHQGRTVMATPNLKKSSVSVIVSAL
ncbi:MAG: cytochrome C oxidase Cbb3 [gamma proteobacterium symbiont of Phacoides pectinatus]